ncbi:MAG: Crp/Fnr family transcriptional regulator [Oscillibacter sp.]|nr:Crp/Fnr family transcriptional regulator [Oscillibacter sp.]
MSRSEEKQLPRLFEKYGKVLHCKKGQSIYIQEYEAEAFYMVKRGTLRSFVMGSDGREITLELLSPGKVFGTVSFFGGTNRIASVAALSDAEVLVLNHETLQQCFGEHYSLVVEVIQTLGVTTQFLVSQVESLTIISAEGRIAHTLLQLALDFKKAPGAASYHIPYTHQQIAELAGMSRVATTKALNAFAARGWVQLGYREVTVLDENALRRRVRQGEET